MKRKVSALIIICASASVSLLILYRSENTTSADILAQIIEMQKESPTIHSALRFARKNTTIDAPQAQNTLKSVTEEKNLTKRFARTYAKQLAAENPGGIDEIKKTGNLDSLSPDVATQLFSSQITAQKLEYPQFEIKDLRVTQDVSRERQIAYVQALTVAWQKNFSGKKEVGQAMHDWILQKNQKPLEQYIAAISPQVNDLLTLEVPESWQWLHLENLNLWEKKLATYRAILEMNEDPIKGMVALKALEEITQQNEVLQNVLRDTMKKLL